MILNDIDYEKYSLDTIRLCTKHSLSGKVVSLTSINNCKKIIYQDLRQFVEDTTVEI